MLVIHVKNPQTQLNSYRINGGVGHAVNPFTALAPLRGMTPGEDRQFNMRPVSPALLRVHLDWF